MPDLKTRYLGLELANPLIVGASTLTATADEVAKCAKAGAGAVVLKSLFQEQIELDKAELDHSLAAASPWHAEVFEYMEADLGMRYGPREYLDVIRGCKDRVGIPVIASINCIGTEWWQEFAADVEAAGADALELNVAIVPERFDVTAGEIEDTYEAIVRAAASAVGIPVAVKLPLFCTALPHLVLRLRRAGARGFVLFNRFYRPAIDVEQMKIVHGERLSRPGELSDSLRWISHFSGRVDADFAANCGIHDAQGLIGSLLVGASAAQVVSAAYANGLDTLARMLDGLAAWMDRRNLADIEQVRGRLSQSRNPDSDLFGRYQYIKGLVGVG